MKKKMVSALLTACMTASLLAGCGSSKETADSSATEKTETASESKEAEETEETDETETASAETESGDETYTFRNTYTTISTWSPTDWELSTEWNLLTLTSSAFYGFWMNEAQDGYDIVCELASELPVDKTADYAGKDAYGVPSDAEEGYAWQIAIRDDATWEDGTPITTDDVEYSIQQFLNPEMKNYRASLLYSGSIGLANAEAYYNNDWMQGAALTDYTDYMTEDVYNGLDALANEDGYIPMTEESIELVHSFTGSDDWGNESEEDLINYAFCEDGVAEEIPWENVGFVKDDDYTFTIILKNPTTEFNIEYNIDNLVLVKEDLYEANKQVTGGISKSS